MLETGDDAPAFELPNQHGDPVSLSDLGPRAVLYFYPRADTPGCTTEARGFRDALAEFEARDVAVVGISDDPVDDLASFAGKHDLDFDLLADESGEVAAAYGSYGEKNMFGNTFDGVFRNTYVVREGSAERRSADESNASASGYVVERAYEGATPEGHAEEILADL